MPRCFDCHWYETAPPAGRESSSCNDLGELAQSQACDQFTRRVESEEVFLDLKPDPLPTLKQREEYIGALKNQSYAEIFHEILAENFVLSQDAYRSMKAVQAQLQTQGAEITAQAADFDRTAQKLIDIYVTYRLACAVGLGAFVDRIMQREIENKFRPPPGKDS